MHTCTRPGASLAPVLVPAHSPIDSPHTWHPIPHLLLRILVSLSYDMRPVTLPSPRAHYYAPCDSPRPIVSLDLTSDTHSHSFRMKVPSECQATACDALSDCLARVYALHSLCLTTPRYAMFPVLVPRLPLCTLRCSPTNRVLGLIIHEHHARHDTPLPLTCLFSL